MHHSNHRIGFKSKFGAIAALAGSAVGLGNIWKFPYVAGTNGGGAFLLVYIFFTIAIGLPVMLAEFSLGRRSQQNALGEIFRIFFEKLGTGHEVVFVRSPLDYCSHSDPFILWNGFRLDARICVVVDK